ncbi:MAG: autotransporter outer membrane beta-barrel domain-containing protein, partial [Geobacter sp.]
PGIYLNGTTYDIVETTGGTVSGSFGSVLLPASKPLLSFALNQSSNVVELEVTAPKVTTVATNPVEYAMAEYLDRIMPTASGDLAAVLGEFQGLESSQLGAAIAGMNSGSYTSLSKVSMAGIGLFLGDLKQRMGKLRVNMMTADSGSGTKPILLAYSGSAAELGRIVTIEQSTRGQTMNGLWINSYGQWGDHQALPGYAGYDYTLYGSAIGYDYTFPGNLLLGASLGMSRAEVDFGSSQGDGSVNSVTGALYGSYYAGNAYIEGTFSYGKQRYHNSRFISVGTILREASGKHDADAFTTYLGAGYNFTANWLTISPFASLRHIHLAEEGFTETGADSLNLAVESRKTDSLVSELGLRLARSFAIGNASVIPELSAALNYDFDIDDQVVTASFAGAPGNTFSIRGEEVEKYGAAVAAGLTFIHRSGVSAVLKYLGEFRERNSSHGLMGEFRYLF